MVLISLFLIRSLHMIGQKVKFLLVTILFFGERIKCGAWIFRGHYGRKDSEYGWVIDHIKPLSEGGTNDISNLRPMQ